MDLYVQERAAADLLISASPHATILRRQLEAATVIGTQQSEVGIVREFSIPSSIPPVPDKGALTLSGVDIAFECGATCAALLFLRDGYIDALEVVTLEGTLPDFSQKEYAVRWTAVIPHQGNGC